MQLGTHSHGKARVRVAKVFRTQTHHTFVEYNVELLLYGGTSESFLHGDNSHVVATDTCKNHVYVMAKTHPCESPEQFAVDLAQRMLNEYSWLTRVQVIVEEKGWKRIRIGEEPHSHGFERGVEIRGGQVDITRGSNPLVKGVLKGLPLLKTTQSGWEGFWQDQFTTLPETRERILASEVSAEWGVDGNDWTNIANKVRAKLVEQFMGDVKTGVYSKGVQDTMWKMARAACQVQNVQWVKLSMPNLHFLPCMLPVYDKNGIKFQDDVYIPTDEPHGIISATVTKARKANL